MSGSLIIRSEQYFVQWREDIILFLYFENISGWGIAQNTRIFSLILLFGRFHKTLWSRNSSNSEGKHSNVSKSVLYNAKHSNTIKFHRKLTFPSFVTFSGHNGSFSGYNVGFRMKSISYFSIEVLASDALLDDENEDGPRSPELIVPSK